MAGVIKQMLDTIVRERSRGNPTFIESTRCKLILRGLHPDKFTAQSPDDPVLIAKARQIATEFGVAL